MAKSLRSKVKREFRSKKRQAGVYAATEAARLARLNTKLLSTVSKDKKEFAENEEEGDEENMPGWCWFATFGLLDPNDITVESMSSLTTRGNEYMGGNREGWHAALEEDSPENSNNADDSMQLDQPSADTESTRVSTHGPRGSRREEWRLSKGLSARPASKGMNRQGGIAARRKAGRSKRRR
ncbi:hypothetical protein D9758_001258 [Tetrapyrgos nigripes]|uniref:DUF2423 domain-containing protein n=1 Tax=Tetrapyrgos nigripes TaxID=182062 RepID=A0A8H5GS63_9AGAR|nr:hypothetical protein D9758_001258 [Tetrapyrgos nigripes]